VPSYLGFLILREQYMGVFLAQILACTFMSVPATKRERRTSIPWFDRVMALGGLACGLYIAVLFPHILATSSRLSLDRVVLGGIAILLILEGTRRLLGWALVIIVMVFMFYARFSNLFPDVLIGTGESWRRLFSYLFLDTSAILGSPTVVISGMVLVFVVLGQALLRMGGGSFFTDAAMSAFGRARAGPAKAAVISSALFGMVSGSTAANVVTTGTITIPLMKRTGFKAEMAGAIEAVASNGGQIAPPIMGAAAFLMADILGISYSSIALAATIPAAIYFFYLYMMVDRYAARNNIRGVSGDIPRIRTTLSKGGVFIIPIVVLLFGMFYFNYRPEKAGMLAVLATVVVSFFNGYQRPQLKTLAKVLEGSGRSMLPLGVVGAAAGLVIGALSLSGLGVTVSFLVADAAGQSLVVLLIFAALTSIVLGMGLPTIAAYVIVAVVVAPSIVSLGVPPLAAHMFVFYFALAAHVTPPVCVSTYIAAGLAGADNTKTVIRAMALSAPLYGVPFLFVLSSPGMLLEAPALDIAGTAISAAAGVAALAIALNGYLAGVLPWLWRSLIGLGAVALLVAPGAEVDAIWPWIVRAAGLAALIILVSSRLIISGRGPHSGPGIRGAVP
jgi:TRAP transporter 4TM/12TM fusion protein